MKKFIHANRVALLLALLYFVPAIGWVLFSDRFLLDKGSLPLIDKYRKLDYLKEFSFVTGISLMIFFILRTYGSKLKKSRLEYELLFERHPYPMWIYETSSLKVQEVNQAAIDHYGYSKNEFLAMTLWDIIATEERPRLEQLLQGGIKRGRACSTWKHKKKDGSIIVLEFNGSDVQFNDKACRLVAATDITDKLRKEEENKKLSLVAENTTNSIIITNSLGQIEWVNKSFTVLTGYSLEEVKGRMPQEFLHGAQTDKRVSQTIMERSRAGRSFTGEILNYRKDGSTFWIRLTLSPAKNIHGITNYIAVQTDITSIKQQNEKLREIAFIVSHNFRRPVANILGLTDLLELMDDEQPTLAYLKQSARELDEELVHIAHAVSLIKLQPGNEPEMVLH